MRVKSENRRHTIMSAAIEVFREKGYERASMAEISARVGASKATLYSYFTSKALWWIVVLGVEPGWAAIAVPAETSAAAHRRRVGRRASPRMAGAIMVEAVKDVAGVVPLRAQRRRRLLAVPA